MQNLITYLIEVAIASSIFYAFYKYLYFKLAYFQWSRYFFLTTLALSLIIPFIYSPIDNQLITSFIKVSKGIAINSSNNSIFIVNQTVSKSNFIENFINIIAIIWFIGFAIFLSNFIRKIFQIIKLITKSNIIKDEKFKIVETNLNETAFSFFNYIFVNSDFYNLSEDEQNQILKHEKIHASDLHSIDNIIFEIYKAIFWFNPISRRISDSVKEVHEFIVDNKLTGNKNQSNYSRLIVKLISSTKGINTVSNFAKSNISDRIKLISYPETQKIRKKRFIISIPVLILVIFSFYLITSSVNQLTGWHNDNIHGFIPPLEKGNYEILSPFFINKKAGKLFSEDVVYKDKILISFPKIAYSVKSNSEIYAINSGIIQKIDTVDNWGLKEFKIEMKLDAGYKAIYENIYKVSVKVGDKVKVGDEIAKTGDNRLYPSIQLQLLKNEKPINPKYCY